VALDNPQIMQIIRMVNLLRSYCGWGPLPIANLCQLFNLWRQARTSFILRFVSVGMACGQASSRNAKVDQRGLDSLRRGDRR
jgi:hypothetical protein